MYCAVDVLLKIEKFDRRNMNEKKSDRNSISFFYIDIDYGIKWKFVYYVKISFRYNIL